MPGPNSDKKTVDLSDLLTKAEDGHVDWVSGAQFRGDISAGDLRFSREELAVQANGNRKAARLLGDTLIKTLNELSSGKFPRTGHGIKIKVAKAPQAADEMTPLQAQELFTALHRNNRQLSQTLERLREVQANIDRLPTAGALAATAVELEKNVNQNAIEIANSLSEELRSAIAQVLWKTETVERTDRVKTMSRKGYFWYKPRTGAICEGLMRPAGEGWVPLVPDPNAKSPGVAWTAEENSPGADSPEALKRAASEKAALARARQRGTLRTMPRDVNERVDRMHEALKDIEDRNSFPIRFAADLDEGNLKHLREDYFQMLGHLENDLKKIVEARDLGLDAGERHDLAIGMLDHAGRIADTLARWRETVEHLGRHTITEASESGVLRAELSL